MTSFSPAWNKMSDDLKIIEMMADGFDHVDSKIKEINDDLTSIKDSINNLEFMLGDTSHLNNKSVVDTLNTIVEMLETSQATVSIAMQQK